MRLVRWALFALTLLLLYYVISTSGEIFTICYCALVLWVTAEADNRKK